MCSINFIFCEISFAYAQGPRFIYYFSINNAKNVVLVNYFFIEIIILNSEANVCCFLLKFKMYKWKKT